MPQIIVSTFSMPDIVLGARDMKLNKTEKTLPLRKSHFLPEEIDNT